MKTKNTLIIALLSAGLLTATSALAGGPGHGKGPGACSGQGQPDNPACDRSGPNRGDSQCDGSGKGSGQCKNEEAPATPLRDGSGKSTAPGKGAKDGSGARKSGTPKG